MIPSSSLPYRTLDSDGAEFVPRYSLSTRARSEYRRDFVGVYLASEFTEYNHDVIAALLMANYIRRLVSGDKARFKDGKLNLELDLIYLTDHIIIMGYPAAGIEGLYRNRKEDTKKFLEHRHGKNYWIFNFCPIRENSYDSSFFDGRVSRYPYPDHHAPPLAVMPLLAREMRAWLNGSPDRVAVLHCKAGKGRSGTMACTYLLSSNDTTLSPPRLERSYTAKQWAKIKVDDAMDIVPDDVDEDSTIKMTLTPIRDTPDPNGVFDNQGRTSRLTSTHEVMSPTPTVPASGTSFTGSLKGVLDLHTSRRMKAPSPGKKHKQGVSIPSQRRWLYYWSLLLAHQAPSHLWKIPRFLEDRYKRPKVRLTQITLRMRESSGVKINLVRAANIVMNQTKKAPTPATGNGYGHVWISLARYDDNLVEILEEWEKRTRDETHMGWRKPGTEHVGEEEVGKIFVDGKWDTNKMVRSFARLGAVGDGAVVKTQGEKEGKVVKYTLRALTDDSWNNLRDELKNGDERSDLNTVPEDPNVLASETNSVDDLMQGVSSTGVVLDAGREVRVKLYMGQVFMGWIWFVPVFHMPELSFASSQKTTTLLLTRKEIDFPLGIGSEIIDVEISLEWLGEKDTEVVQPPTRLNSQEEAQKEAAEPSGIATIHAATATTVSDIVQAKQAAQD